MSNGSTQIRGYDPGWTQGLLVGLLVGTGGLLVGIAIGVGTEKLLYALALLAIPFALLWPAQTALGAVGLSLQFDAVLFFKAGTGAVTLTWFVAAGAVALLMVRILTGVRQAPPRAAMWWVVLIAWASATTLWAVDSGVALWRMPSAWSLLFFYLVAVSSRITRKELDSVIALTVLGGAAAAAWAGWAYLHNSFYHYDYHANVGGRASLVSGDNAADPNFFAAMLLVPFSLAIGIFLSTPKRLVKMLMVLASGLVGMGIVLSMSRGSLVALILMFGVYVYRLGVKPRTLAGVAVLLIVLAMMAPPAFWTRLQPENMRTGAGRTNVWAAASQIVKHNFVAGVGLSNFPVAYQTYAGSAPTFMGYHASSHNTYLNILGEQGVIGLALFLLAVMYQFFGLRRYSGIAPESRPLLVSFEAALVAVLGAAFFIDFLWTKAFWFALILCTLVSRVDLSPETSPARLVPADRKLSPAETVLNDPIFTR